MHSPSKKTQAFHNHEHVIEAKITGLHSISVTLLDARRFRDMEMEVVTLTKANGVCSCCS
jgi:hypothetical protein